MISGLSNDLPYTIPIDDGLHYSSIVAFGDEWNTTFWDERGSEPTPGPMYFWFRCLDHTLRGYFFIEGRAKKLLHNKEAFFATFRLFKARGKILVNGANVDFRAWLGGGEFIVDVGEEDVRIEVKGWKHYTIFPISQCKKSKPPSKEMKVIMNIHTRTFDRPYEMNEDVVKGVANHFAYHRCLLKIDQYELVVQPEQVPIYMKNAYIASAVRQGLFVFILKNIYHPPPIHMPGTNSNCYYQAVTQNLAILQHWKENIRIFFYDTDEYVSFPSGMTESAYKSLLQENPLLGFQRDMVFCASCNKDQSESESLSFRKQKYVLGGMLRDPKLVVDPNVAGCFIIHWAGCGGETKILDNFTAVVHHFENMYNRRWHHSKTQLAAMPRLQPTEFTFCDPSALNSNYDQPFSKFYFDGKY